jgi:hypothetical protein
LRANVWSLSHRLSVAYINKKITTLEKENTTHQKLITTLEQQARDLADMITAGKDNLTNAIESVNEVKQLQLQVTSLQGEKQAAAELLDKSEK